MHDAVVLFHEAVAAYDRGDYRSVALLCDPASLSLFKRERVECLRSAPARAWTADDILRASPDMPREAAEYQAKQLRAHNDPNRALRDLPGIETPAQLEEADPLDVFAAWLRGQSAEHQVAGAIAAGQVPLEALSVLAHHGARRRHVALGAVPGGDRVAYVLFRSEWGKPETDREGDVPPRELTPEEVALWRDFADGPVRIMAARRQHDGTSRLVANEQFLDLGSVFIGFSAG